MIPAKKMLVLNSKLRLGLPVNLLARLAEVVHFQNGLT